MIVRRRTGNGHFLRREWWRAVLGLMAIPAIVASCANMPQVAQPNAPSIEEPAETAGSLTPPPKHPLAYYHFLLGYYAEIGKDAETAIEQYRLALRRDPDSVYLRARLASLYYSKGMMAEALRYAERVAESDVRQASILTKMAGVYAGAGRTDDALKLYDRAVALEPDGSEAYFSRGVLLINVKRYEEAEESFRRGSELAQGNPVGEYYLGRIGAETNRPEVAIRHFQRAIEIRPS